MKYLLSMFAKIRTEDIIRSGCMYRMTYKGDRLIKEERLDVSGGYTNLNLELDRKVATIHNGIAGQS
jgi:hypothetical protein